MNKQISAAAAAFGLALAVAAPVTQAEIPLTINMGMGQWFLDGSREVNDTETPWGGLEPGPTPGGSGAPLHATK